MAVRHQPCLLTLKKGIQAFETKLLRKLLCISYLEHKSNDWMWSKVKFLVGPHEHFLVLSRHSNLHGLSMSHTMTASQKHPSGHLGGRVMPRLAQAMLVGQHQRVDIPAHARTAHKGLLQKRLEENIC